MVADRVATDEWELHKEQIREWYDTYSGSDIVELLRQKDFLVKYAAYSSLSPLVTYPNMLFSLDQVRTKLKRWGFKKRRIGQATPATSTSQEARMPGRQPLERPIRRNSLSPNRTLNHSYFQHRVGSPFHLAYRLVPDNGELRQAASSSECPGQSNNGAAEAQVSFQIKFSYKAYILIFSRILEYILVLCTCEGRLDHLGVCWLILVVMFVLTENIILNIAFYARSLSRGKQ